MKRFIVLLALLCVLPVVAFAQSKPEIPFPDDDYVTKYFGVSMLITLPEPIEYGEEGWWTDFLPQELLNGGSYTAGVVNAQRSSNGITPLLNPDDYFISPMYDEQVEAGWQYTIEFIGLRPSEVELVFSTLGGLEQYLPGASVTYMPLLRRSFNVWVDQPGSTLELDINGKKLSVKYGDSIDSIRQRAVKLFVELYGQEPSLDITMGQYSYADGSGGCDFAIYAELPAG